MQATTLTAAPAGGATLLTGLGQLLGRLLIGGVFAIAGVQKIAAYNGTQAYMDAMGVPGGLLPAVIALEIGVGLALIVGFHTRLAALALAAFTVMATAAFHADLADGTQAILFMKNLMVIGGLLTMASVGSGAWSVDTYRATRGGEYA